VHRTVGAMDHQVEHAVLPPVLGRIEERDVAEEDSEPHQRKGCCEAHHDDDDDERQHQQPEHGIADHVCKSPPMPRWRATSSIFCAPSIAIFLDSSSTYWLCASCSSTTSISATSFSRLGHSPVLRQTMQRTISATPCSRTSAPAIGM